MDRYRQIRQQVDEIFRANKKRQFTIEELAGLVNAGEAETTTALNWLRCPVGSCQSYDTELTEKLAGGFEVHRCNRCSQTIHIQRDPRGYSILGWYGE